MPFRATPTLIAIVAGAFTSACVVVPVTTEDYDAECQAITHHMELRTVQLAAINQCNGQGCQVVIIAALGVTAASAIVSGSIVVVGNMAYWAERRTGCPAPVSAPA